MPGGSLGTIRGQIRLDVASAIAGYAAVRTANARTINTMNDARSRMKGFGLAAVGMGAAFLTGFGMAVNAAADFEKKLDYFGAVNNATAKEMEAVRAKALELGKTSVYSASQIADAFVELGKAGVSAQDITDGMADAMVNLAQAADIDLAQATNIVTSSIQAYSLQAKDAAHVTNLMAGAANASIIDVTDIGVSMKYVAGVAHSLGISIDSTIDAISLLGKAGIKGSTAGTSLRQIMVSLAGGTDKAKGELEELGIITADGANKFFTAEGKAKSLSEVFQILQDHTQNLTQKQRLMAFRTIFNNRALAAAQILTKEGAKGFAEMNAEISKTTAAEVAAKRMDNLSGDIRKLKGNIETFLIEGGTPFQSFLRSIVQSLTKLVQAFARLPSGMQTAIFSFMLVAGVLLTMAGAIALVGASLTGAIGAIKSTIGAFKALWAILKAAAVAMRAFSAAALANPYVLIVVAIIAVVAALVLLYKKNEAVRNAMNTMGANIKASFMTAVEWFKGLPAFFSNLWSSITAAFSAGVDWVVAKWNGMVAWIQAAPARIRTAVTILGIQIIDFVTSVPGKVSAVLTTAWNGFLEFMSNLPKNIGYALGFVLGTLTRWGIQAMTWSVNTIRSITTYFSELPAKIGAYFVQLWTNFKAWTIQFVTSVATWTSNTNSTVETWFQKLPGRVGAFFVSMKDKAVSGLKSLWTNSKKLAADTYNGVVGWFQKLPGRIGTFLSNLVSGARNKFGEMVQWAQTSGRDLLVKFILAVEQMPHKVWDILGRVVGAFKDMVRSAANAAKDFASGLWNGFKDGLGIHSPSYIEHAMWAITRVTGTETKRLKGQVRTLRGLGGTLHSLNNGLTDSQLKSEEERIARLNEVRAGLRATGEHLSSIFPEDRRLLQALTSKSIRDAEHVSGMTSMRPGVGGSIHVTVNNPIAERASDSTARKLRTLSSMGAF